MTHPYFKVQLKPKQVNQHNIMANDNALHDDPRIQGSFSGNQEERYNVLILIKLSICPKGYMHHFYCIISFNE